MDLRDKTFTYVEYLGEDGPDYTTITITGKEILKQYYPYWSKKLREQGREYWISENNCIEDFCVVHWAQAVK